MLVSCIHRMGATTMHVRFAVGVIGNVATLSTSLAPIPTFWRICKNRSTQEFSALPYAMSFACNLFWAWYALPMITVNNFLLLIISAAQVSLQSLYLVLYFMFTCWGNKAKLLMILFTISAVFGVDSLVTMQAFHSEGKRRFVAGSAATAASLATFAAPLSIMGLVIRTRSVEYMPLLLSLSIFFNCFTWTVYGALGKDMFLVIADGLGSLLAIVQLILYALYCNAKPHVHVEETLRPADPQKVELQIISVDKLQVTDQSLETQICNDACLDSSLDSSTKT